MKPLLMIAAALLGAPAAAQTVYHNPAVEQSEEYLSGNPCQRDLLLFVDLLRTTHPVFCTGEKHPFDPDSLARAEYAAAADCPSAAALSVRLQRIAARLRDGHTRVYAPSENPNRYPFGIFRDGDRLRLTSIVREHEALLGRVITAINDRPVAEVLDGFRQGISCDNEAACRVLTDRMLPTREAWQNHPADRPDSLLRLTFDDATSIFLKPCPRKACDMVSIPRRKPEPTVRQTKEPFACTLLGEKGLCYLFFNKCADRESYRLIYRYRGIPVTEEVERELQKIPRFEDFLDEMFSHMQQQGITTLVVDLRSNQGGNSRLCDELLSRLQPLDELRKYTASIRLSPLWEEQYPEPARQLREACSRAGRTLDTEHLYDLSDPIFDDGEPQMTAARQDSTAGKPLFRGRVILVQSDRTFSSAGILSTMVADNVLGTIIGQPSSFRPTHYGDILSWELPETKIRGSVSHKIFRRPDPSRDGEDSLRPDVVLTLTWDDYLKGTDRFQQWIMENL